ncbi:MAG: alpha/beta hydrolase [Candidatus Thermoplasmatota archaeon]|jgi:acetyl esterase|nr:alpha/beta hydrolase [Candidatus Thermoplasmatota archaeon]
MALDPDVKKFLEMMKSMPPFDPNMPVGKARELELSEMARMPREDVKSVAEHKIPGSSIWLREYVPSKSASNGALLYIHGGGYVFGSVETYDPFVRHFCNLSGMRIYSLEYRLAPENKFPAAHDDSFAAYQWLLNNSSDLKLDPGRISVMGDSAGGSLAAYVTHKSVASKTYAPASQVLLYPALGDSTSTASFTENGSGYLLTKEMMSWFGEQYSNRSVSDQVRRRYHVEPVGDPESFPLSIVVTAEYDPLRDAGELYAGSMMQFGAKVVALRANGMIHGFMTNYLMIRQAEEYLKAVSGMIQR